MSLALSRAFRPPLHTPPQRQNTHRIIEGLELAWATDEAPSWAHATRPDTKARAQGAKLEKELAKILPSGAKKNPWFQFIDSNGGGYCQPDWLVPLGKGKVLVLECKRTECPEATTQLTKLYFPVLGKALGAKIFGMVVVRYLTTSTPIERVYSEFEPALQAALRGEIPIFHWMKAL